MTLWLIRFEKDFKYQKLSTALLINGICNIVRNFGSLNPPHST